MVTEKLEYDAIYNKKDFSECFRANVAKKSELSVPGKT